MENQKSDTKTKSDSKPAGVIEDRPASTQADRKPAGMVKESLVGQVDLSKKSQSDLDKKSPFNKWRESLFFKPKKVQPAKEAGGQKKEEPTSIFKQAGQWAKQEKLQEALLKAHKEVNPLEKFYGGYQEKQKVFGQYFPDNSQKFFKQSDIKKQIKDLENHLTFSAKPGQKEQLRKQIATLKKIA